MTESTNASSDDPVAAAFLALIVDQIERHPEQVVAFSAEDIDGTGESLAGVEYDLSESLDDAFELP